MVSPRSSESTKYWPGGIPAHIKCHPEPIDEPLEFDPKEETKGWILFLEENYVPPNSGEEDLDYEVKQRRQLISDWASMSQDARDAYHDRAPLPASCKPPAVYKMDDLREVGMPSADCYCVAPLQGNPRNRALWTKMRILTYYLNGNDGPIFSSAVAEPNPDSGDAVVTPETFLRWNSVEAADFWFMAMTRQGTIVFTYSFCDTLFVDQEALDTGKLLLCSFSNNGELYESARIGIWLLSELWLMRSDGLYEMDLVNSSRANGPINLEPPILDVLDELANTRHFDGGIDEWMDDIERYAPGYLDMEEKAGDGMVPDYDHARFRSAQELMSIPRADIPPY